MALEKALVDVLESMPDITVRKLITDRGKVVLCLWEGADYCYQYVDSSFTNYVTRRAFEDTNRQFDAYVRKACIKKLEELYRRRYDSVFPCI